MLARGAVAVLELADVDDGAEEFFALFVGAAAALEFLGAD
jgi:hypothetical protein